MALELNATTGVSKRIAGAARTGLGKWPTFTDRRLWRYLRDTIVSFTFNEQPIMEAVDFLKALGRVKIFLDQTQLRNPKQTVTRKLSNVPFLTALKLLTEQVGLRHHIRSGRLVFARDDAAPEGSP